MDDRQVAANILPVPAALGWILVAAVAWLAFAGATGWMLRTSPRQDGDVATAIAYRVLQAYVRVFHALRLEGVENIPRSRTAGPLIVISNHASGVDPLLIQAVCPFEVRWMMAEEMRLPWLEPVWQWAGIIFVDRSQKQTMGARVAIRGLQSGGVLGLFPEGGLERPPRRIQPFLHGVGLLVARTRAPVLPFVIEKNAAGRSAWASLIKPGRSRVRAMPILRYEDRSLRAEAITEDLHRRYLDWTGWPAALEQASAAPKP